MIQQYRVVVTVAGAAGSASGSAVSDYPLYGKVVAVHVDYTDQPNTADVTITAGVPAQTLLTVTNANTDGWFYPRVQTDTDAGAAISGGYDLAGIAGYVTVSVAQGDAGSVACTLLIEE
jgi:hypothetical protein